MENGSQLTVNAYPPFDDQDCIPFDKLMEWALYDPRYGYYSQHVTIGVKGDFMTAPEHSSLFAECFWRAFRAHPLGADCLVEFGAGRGTFAADILACAEREGIPLHYHILERSGRLRAEQHKRLAAWPHVTWHESLETLPKKALVFANEVFDAMSVYILRQEQSAYMQAWVQRTSEGLEWRWRLCDPLIAERCQNELALPALQEQQTFEFNAQLKPWLTSLKEHFEQAAFWIVDYGDFSPALYGPARLKGTLIRHRHRQADDHVLSDLGLSDLTSFVNFTQCRSLLEALAFEDIAIGTQKNFLLAHGMLDDLQKLAPQDKEDTQSQAALSRAWVLMDPSEMGERFKVLYFKTPSSF